MELVFTSTQLIGVCTLVTSIWAVFKIVKEINKPNEELKVLVDKHSEMLDNDNKRLNKTDEDMKMILRSLYVILEHEATGNHVHDMEKTKEELNDYLIHR